MSATQVYPFSNDQTIPTSQSHKHACTTREMKKIKLKNVKWYKSDGSIFYINQQIIDINTDLYQ